MATVRILGLAPNIQDMPPFQPGVEVWACNNPYTYRKLLPSLIKEDHWTRWFNLHSRMHMQETYPAGYFWYTQQSKPIYTQRHQPDIPGCITFPGKAIQEAFPLPDGTPTRYFTCSVCWLIAFAILEGFTHIELWGFELRDKRAGRHAFERPCFFYWVQQARDRGIDVMFPPEVAALPFEPGDPTTYTGPLYGYETKPE
jgi:hypothetical protein